MAKIQLFFAAELQNEYLLDDRLELTVGRAPTCDIVVDNFAVSRHHCTIRLVGRQWHVLDEGSSNGTFVNGDKVTEHVLKHKDRVVLGKHTLVFDAFGYAPSAEERDVEPSEKLEDGTVFMSKEAIDKVKARSEQQQSMGLVLAGVHRQIVPLAKEVTVIGASPWADLRIQGLFVKREQALVVKTRNGHKIVHTGGWRSLRVNGEKREQVLLWPGDLITIAGNRISYGNL